MGLEHGQPTPEQKSATENLDRENQLLEIFIKDVEPGSARAWAIADYINNRETNRVLEDERSKLEVIRRNADPLNIIESESSLRITEQIYVSLNMRMSNHAATLKGYIQASTFLDQLVYQVMAKLDSDEEASLLWLDENTHVIFDYPEDDLDTLLDRHDLADLINDPKVTE